MCSFDRRVYFEDYVFVFNEKVYAPAEDSFLFAENLEVEKDESVLDMGTGCGILSVLAAKNARDVMAVDVNPYAIRCTKENAILNNVRGKIAFMQGDLFTSLNEKARFDVILFNAPYLPVSASDASSWIERAWAGGVKGRQVINRFISEVPNHLTGTGRVLMMQSTLANLDETVQRFTDRYLNTQIMADQALPFFETVALIEAKI